MAGGSENLHFFGWGEGGVNSQKVEKRQKKSKKKTLKQRKKTKIVSSEANISNTPFNERSSQQPEEGVLNCNIHTNKQTDIATL